MKKSFFLLILFCILGFDNHLNAQKISDGQPIDLNGMSVSFNITNKESIQVGGKPFDRYKVSASVKNTSDKSYNIRLSSSPQIVTDTGIVETGLHQCNRRKTDLKKDPAENENTDYQCNLFCL
ncbi:hypothetical protein J3D55_003644 [Chryseobacterium ginsenosidimutans]|uniref:hypothetical protein n=1 Tax=Chryseobacterium ginsenosidimutans TaxID=687846 RepID=UPI00216879A7|nr:hypothetical protein [Chryseobacterium ginsenosidimutans]MCS3870728.1 hypothetical protein [Chryseobacterium ginsenosidimutans]